MLVLGSLLALLSGMLNAAAAALEKHQGMHTGTSHKGMRLLVALARRPLWLLAIGLSAVAWVCEAASLAAAPVPVVATLRNAGRGLLVLGGGRWLDERFTALEIVGVALASAGGAVTAIGSAASTVVRRPLSNMTELIVGACCCVAAFGVAAGAARLADGRRPGTDAGRIGPRRRNAAGIATGAAVGLLFAATGVYTKEIGDRFALYGLGGLTPVLASASLWPMIVISVWAQSLVQQAFRRANAASVSAANAAVASLGLIAAGFLLYGENVPGGVSGVMLFAGMGISLAGTVLLLTSRPVAAGAGPDGPAPPPATPSPPAATSAPR